MSIIMAFLQKILAAVAFAVLSVTKVALRVLLPVYKIISVPLIIFSAINGVATFIGGASAEALISFGFVAVLTALYVVLPVVISLLEKWRGGLYYVMRRPLSYKPRIRYTLS